jgi:glycosyltransferase involved in cell wall biosynthesis
MQKVKKKVLVVGTYPITLPQHGGQKRLSAIISEYKKNITDVKYTSVFYDGFYSEYSADDIPLGKTGRGLVQSSPLTGDIICGKAIYFDPEVKQKFTHLLKMFSPDIIHIEQPYPYLGLKPLLRELGMDVKLVFGSQNVEGPMKADILRGYGTDQVSIDRAVNEINDVEIELSKDALLVAACTKDDLKAHEMMGAKKIVLAPNGVEEPVIQAVSVEYWQRLFSTQGVEQTAVFVGSAHPPNWAGFTSMITTSLGFVKNNQRIVIAGSVSDFADREIGKDKLSIAEATFWLRAYSAGRLSESRLVGLIAQSDVVLLPITEGGGSNLKTAEAIISGKKVVTTSHALRSFEWFSNYPNVWVANSPEEFRQAIVEAFNATPRVRNEEQIRRAESVLWRNCLNSLVEEVSKL